MKKLYLIRHGQSKWNIEEKVQGQTDISLTKKGKHEAELMGKRLKNKKIDSIYSSDLSRAYETASIIGEKIDKKIKTMEELREMNFGIWEGMYNLEIKEKEPIDFILWRKDPCALKIEKGETLDELQERAMNAINNIINNDPGKNIVIISHGATLKTIILGLIKMELFHFKNLTLSNVGLTIIEFRDYNKVIKVLNDTSHIKEGNIYEG